MSRTTLVVSAVLLVAAGAGARVRPDAQIVETIDGDPLYKLLPVGGIPAIDDPVFVVGEEANGQMRPEEPVMGVVMGDTARAYSMWQLDAHEIVNDTLEGSAIAVTW
jgi:hypothetical protein